MCIRDRAAELRTMGAMGYDAVTVGNHEFDYTGPGFGEKMCIRDSYGTG